MDVAGALAVLSEERNKRHKVQEKNDQKAVQEKKNDAEKKKKRSPGKGLARRMRRALKSAVEKKS